VGGWSAPRSGRFTPRKDPVPIVQEAGWAPGPVWKFAKNLAPTRIDPRIVQPVASLYTDWAIPARGCANVPPRNSQNSDFLWNAVTVFGLDMFSVSLKTYYQILLSKLETRHFENGIIPSTSNLPPLNTWNAVFSRTNPWCHPRLRTYHDLGIYISLRFACGPCRDI
jgi:hypothetical protein